MARIVFLTLVGFGGILLTFYPTILSGFERMQPEAGDVLLNNLFLEHSYRWAFDRDYPFSFWSPGFYYPTRDTFTYSETLIGGAPIYWLLRGVGFSEVLSAQLWIIVVLAMNFASMAIVLRWFGVNTLFTSAGAYVFAFGLIRIDQLNHQHLLPQFFSPFAVWYAWMMLREPLTRRWILFNSLCVLQVLASLHLGWFLGFAILIFVVVGLFVEVGSWSRLRQFVRSRPVGVIVPLIAGAVVVGMYARNFYRGAPAPREYGHAAFYCPYPDCWFVGAPGSLWSDRLFFREPVDLAEKALFQGLAIFAMFLAAGWFAWRRKVPSHGLVLSGVGTAAILMLLVTKWGWGTSLWFFVHHIVPGANAFRAVGRIAFVAYLFGLVGGLIGIQELLNKRIAQLQVRRAIIGVIAALMIVEQVRPFPEHFDKRQEFLEPARSLAPMFADVDTVYVMYDGTRPDYRHEIIVMWTGNWTNKPVMNGFSGAAPPNHPGFGARPSIEELLNILGPQWQGKLAIIEWGPPVTRKVYQVVPGEDASRRTTLIRQS